MDKVISDIEQQIDNITVSTSLTCTPEECSTHLTDSRATCLNIVVQNIRSIAHNIDGFHTLLSRIDVEQDIIVLTESWLSRVHTVPHLANYNSYNSTKLFNQNDGLVIYTKSGLDFDVQEPAFSEANCILMTQKKKIAIIAIYRPPSFLNVDKFLVSLDHILNTLTDFSSIAIVGDINIDIKTDTTDRHASEYLNLTASYGLLPAHTLSTRNLSCLDHVILRTSLSAKTLVVENSLTDHFTVILSLELSNQIKRCPLLNISKINFMNISAALASKDFQSVIDCHDCDIAAELLTREVSDIIKANTIEFRVPKRKLPLKPWITAGLIRCMRNRDNLHKRLRKSPENTTLRTTYTRYRNFLTRLLRKTKLLYERSQIQQADTTKKMWQVINSVAGINPKQNHSSQLLSVESNPEAAVNKANAYYATVGEGIALGLKTLQSSNPVISSLPKITGYSASDSFVLLETDLSEVINIINSLKCTNTTGYDGISTRILKENKVILAGLLTHVCNLAINQGRFPRAFKKSVIVPVYKSGPKNEICNYRPISILPTFSKILERILNNRLVNYLEYRGLISGNQYGFRRNKSTADAVGDLTDYIVRGLDSGAKCLAIFLDLAKAFDTVSIPRILCKLESLGVRGLQLQLFRDYLTDRKQSVKIESVTSSDISVTYGVPQGSILGPTLFLVYINDLCNLQLVNGRLFTYADDTALVFKGESWKSTFHNAQIGFNKTNEWLFFNLLKLNAGKTKYITFSMLNKTQPDKHQYNILAHTNVTNPASCAQNICDCPKLECTNTLRYLGITLDSQMSFEPHVKILTARVRKLIAIFKNIRHVTDKSTIRTVYFSLCQSLIMYCIETWGGTAKTYLLSLERAQRAVLKVSHFLPYRFSTRSLFQKVDVLTVRQLFILRLILKQHKLRPLEQKKRRNDKVFSSTSFKTSFINRFSCFLGGFMYNKLSKDSSLQHLSTFQLKSLITEILRTYSYEDTENLLAIVK